MAQFNVKGSVAFVTGTNKERGIGRAIVRALLQAGAKKVYATARKAEQLDDLVKASEGRVEAVALDVTDQKAVAALPSPEAGARNSTADGRWRLDGPQQRGPFRQGLVHRRARLDGG